MLVRRVSFLSDDIETQSICPNSVLGTFTRARKVPIADFRVAHQAYLQERKVQCEAGAAIRARAKKSARNRMIWEQAMSVLLVFLQNVLRGIVHGTHLAPT